MQAFLAHILSVSKEVQKLIKPNLDCFEHDLPRSSGFQKSGFEGNCVLVVYYSVYNFGLIILHEKSNSFFKKRNVTTGSA